MFAPAGPVITAGVLASPSGGPQVPGSVRAVLVVMRGVAVQDGPQVPFAGEEHPAGHLGSNGADPASGRGVRRRAPRWDLHHLEACAAGRRAGHLRALPGPAADQEPERATPLSLFISRFRACCAVRAPSGHG
jgi:hypothetical protein